MSSNHNMTSEPTPTNSSLLPVRQSAESKNAKTTTSRPKNPEACLLGLPVELRAMILAEVLSIDTIHDQWPLFLICGPVFDMRSLGSICNPTTPKTSILRTCRSLYHEAATVLYSLSNVRFDITVDDRCWSEDVDKVRVGRTTELRLWPYLRNIRLCINLHVGSDEFDVVPRIRYLMQALHEGRRLRRMEVELTWDESKPIPNVLDVVIWALGDCEMRLAKQNVLVRVAGDMEDEEKERIEKQLEIAITRRVRL